jgi:hypothetical protein
MHNIHAFHDEQTLQFKRRHSKVITKHLLSARTNAAKLTQIFVLS